MTTIGESRALLTKQSLTESLKQAVEAAEAGDEFAALYICERLAQGSDIHPLIGQTVIIRTVTHYYTGRLAAIVADRYVLDDAAWIPSAGRWATALESGVLDEVEPYPGQCLVNADVIIDEAPWPHDLPRDQK